jgi:N-acetyl-anhydromuramyl-L-alanine amidase AmpD
MAVSFSFSWRPACDFRRGRSMNGKVQEVRAIILHSTDGHEAGDLETLTGNHPQRPVSAHYYVTRDGRIFKLVMEFNTAFHAGSVVHENWSNACTIGIEQEHVDYQDDWPDAQVLAVARIVADIRRRHGWLVPVLSHAHVAYPPGRKVDPASYPWGRLAKHVKGISK